MLIACAVLVAACDKLPIPDPNRAAAQKEHSAHAHLSGTFPGGGVARDPSVQGSTMLMGLGDQGEVKKVLNVKNMPDTPFTSSTLMLPALEVRGSSSMNGMNSQEKGLGMPSKPQYVLYCIAGHKLYAGTLPSYDKHNREMIHMGNNAIVDVSYCLFHICACVLSIICVIYDLLILYRF